MNRRERLMASIRGEPVDRPPVSFYEIDGAQDTTTADPFNIYSHPSWQPLIELARAKTDRIVRRGVGFKNAPPDPVGELTHSESQIDAQGSRLTTVTIRSGKRVLTSRWRQDPDVYTVWTLEHLLKDEEDVKAWLDLPETPLGGEPDMEPILNIEKDLGEAGIAMIDCGDPICSAAPLFEMGDFTVMAMTEPKLFRRIMDRFARIYWFQTEAVAKALPGRLWRICGPEYASEPYLPPHLFREYVVPYDKPIVDSIQRYGGFARIHCHGRLKSILGHIAATGCTGLDPVEPPPQGDAELSYVREKVGRQMTLFGNLESSDLENLEPKDFEKKIVKAIREGTAGQGRGFVLMPSSCPYGRVLSPRTLANYEKMIEGIERL